MTRSRASAKSAGTRFAQSIAAYLAEAIGDDRIERRAQSGAKDRGDIGGVRTIGSGRLVIECKDRAKLNLAGWIAEAHIEAGNDDAVAGVVSHKRHGRGNPADQWVTMTTRDLVAILTGERPPEIPREGPQEARQRIGESIVGSAATQTISTPHAS